VVKRPSAIAIIVPATALVVAACSSDTGGSSAVQVGADTFLATNCAQTGAPTESQSASGTAITPDISVLDDNVPIIYVREGAAPAGELVTAEIRAGSGDVAAVDDIITVDYCGVGLSTGTLFDASWVRGTPATFPLSEGQLIQGWVDGIPGMQVGERRVVVIPSDLAYGDTPPPGIEPGETLVFVVELLGVGA